jgi:hypothetical protein
MGEPISSPYDINGQHFNPDMYLEKLLKVQRKHFIAPLPNT